MPRSLLLSSVLWYSAALVAQGDGAQSVPEEELTSYEEVTVDFATDAKGQVFHALTTDGGRDRWDEKASLPSGVP